MKVFHAARQDIEIVWHGAKLIPHPIFDTQVAAMVLGYGDSISYDQLVQRITGDSLDKSHRFTDWTRRPLSDAQVSYAISDVTHLRDVYLALLDDLERRGRTDWVQEEMRRADFARHLPHGAGERLAAAEDARAQAQGAGRADRGRGLARARGAVARRAALARAQGRRDRRHRRAGADQPGKAQAPALAAQGFRTLALGRGDRRGGGARAGPRRAKTLPQPLRTATAGQRRRGGRTAQGAAAHDLRASPRRRQGDRHGRRSRAHCRRRCTPRCRRSPAGAASCSATRRWRSSTASSRSRSRRARSRRCARERPPVPSPHQHDRLAPDEARERAQPAQHPLAGQARRSRPGRRSASR